MKKDGFVRRTIDPAHFSIVLKANSTERRIKKDRFIPRKTYFITHAYDPATNSFESENGSHRIVNHLLGFGKE